MLVDKMGVKDGKVVTKDFNEKVVYKTDKGIWVEESEGANHKRETTTWCNRCCRKR